MTAHRRITFALGLLLAGALFVPLPAAPAAPDADIAWHPRLTFATVDGEALHLGLAVPAGGAGQHPTVVLIHGGGWAGGSRRAYGGLAKRLATEGFVAATIDYRLAPRHPWPAQIEDAKCAVRWLRAHADQYAVDPTRIGAWGASAGGHLAMLLGTAGPDAGFEGEGGYAEHSSAVGAVVSFFGPTDLSGDGVPQTRLRLLDALLGPAFARDRGAASPVTHVDRSDAPMLLFQGTRDPLVPWRQAVAMAEVMTEAGLGGEVVLLPGERHGWRGERYEETVARSIAFLRRHLRRPPPAASEAEEPSAE